MSLCDLSKKKKQTQTTERSHPTLNPRRCTLPFHNSLSGMSFATPLRVACEVIGPARHERRSGAPSASRRHPLFDGCCASDQRISARSPRGLLPVKNCETFREQPLVGRRHGSASPLSCVCGLFTLIPRGAAAPRPLRGRGRRKKAGWLNDECWAQISKLVGEGRASGRGSGKLSPVDLKTCKQVRLRAFCNVRTS